MLIYLDERRVVSGVVGVRLDDRGYMFCLDFRAERGFIDANFNAVVHERYLFAMPTQIKLSDAFRSHSMWTEDASNLGTPLGTRNIQVQLLPPSGIRKGKRIGEARLDGECILVSLQDLSILDWGKESGAAVMGPNVAVPANSASPPVPGLFWRGSARPVPDIRDGLSHNERLRMDKALQLVTDSGLIKEKATNPGVWNWIFNTLSLAIHMLETNRTMTALELYYLFVLPVTAESAQTAILLSLILTILDSTYYYDKSFPLKTTLDEACAVVFPRFSSFHSLFQNCFDTHTVVTFLDILLRAMEETHNHSSYAITGRARVAGGRAQKGGLKFARCPCKLTAEDKRTAAIFMSRPNTLPEDFQVVETTAKEEEEKEEIVEEETGVVPFSSSPPLQPRGYELESVPLWDPSSLPVHVSIPRSPAFCSPTSPAPAPLPNFISYSPTSPPPLFPELDNPFSAPSENELAFLDFDFQESDFLAQLDQLQRISEAKQRVTRKLEHIIREAAKIGCVIEYRFTKKE